VPWRAIRAPVSVLVPLQAAMKSIVLPVRVVRDDDGPPHGESG
jgi:hypothetical protein